MDILFLAQAILLIVLVLELVLRVSTPLLLPAGRSSVKESLNISYLTRMVFFSLIAIKLEVIGLEISHFIPAEFVSTALVYPIWLLPTFAYGIYVMMDHQIEKKKNANHA